MSTRNVRWVFGPIAVVLVLGTAFLVWHYTQSRRANQPANAAGKNVPEPPPGDEGDEPPIPADPIKVEVVNPRRGAMERTTVQVGSVQADEVNLHAQVSGILKPLKVDIGSVVKKGDTLAELRVPDLVQQHERNAFLVKQAEARVTQMKAKVEIATADLEATKAQIAYAEANARASTALLRYREKQFNRMHVLATKNTVEDQLEDEARERFEAARESENTAKTAIIVSNAKVKTSTAKIHLADADVLEAQSQVKLAEAELGKSQIQLDFAKIKAPFNGNITQRPLFEGAFVRWDSGVPQSILTIQRTDLMRVVVQIPAADAPFAHPGDAALVEIDVLDRKFPAKVSRIAKSADLRTRLMPVEIDVKNPDGLIQQGMFGRVTIILENAIKQFSIPSDCQTSKFGDGQSTVYVVRNGRAHRINIKVGMDNGKRVEVLHGLKATDEVIAHPSSEVTEDAEVNAALLDESNLKDRTQP